jgi:hypothetical protein
MYVAIFIITIAAYAWLREKPKQSEPQRPTTSKGDAGEQEVRQDLRVVLEWLCPGEFYLHEGGLVLNHAPRSQFPTAEVDHLAITPFGIFVIETKNWSGSVRCSTKPDELVRIGRDGIASIRKSPLAQNRTKVEFVRSLVTSAWPVESLGVFADATTHLDSQLPTNLIRRDELRSYFRIKAAAYAHSPYPRVQVNMAKDAILRFCDTRADAIERHRLRVASQ